MSSGPELPNIIPPAPWPLQQCLAAEGFATAHDGASPADDLKLTFRIYLEALRGFEREDNLDPTLETTSRHALHASCFPFIVGIAAVPLAVVPVVANDTCSHDE